MWTDAFWVNVEKGLSSVRQNNKHLQPAADTLDGVK